MYPYCKMQRSECRAESSLLGYAERRMLSNVVQMQNAKELGENNFGQIELILSCVPLSEVELLGSCEVFAVARSDNFSAAAVQSFCHLPEGSRCKGTSRRLRFSNVLQLFSVGSEKNRPAGRTLLQCYGVTVPKIVARGV